MRTCLIALCILYASSLVLADITCQRPVDVGLVLDGSGSISDASWKQVLSFCTSLLNKLSIAETEGHLGVVQFSTTGLTNYMIHLTGNYTALKSVISTMRQQDGSGTDISTGIYYSQTDFVRNGRPNVPRLMILMTDGQPNEGGNPVNQANQAKANGTLIFAIGVGSQADFGILAQIASTPTQGYLFNITAFDQLSQIITSIITRSCVTVISVDPTHGPASGGQAVRIIGDGFQNLPTLFCRFGDIRVPATFGGPTVVGCVSPPGVPGNVVEVSVSLDGIDYAIGVNYTYDSITPPPVQTGCPNNCSNNGVCLGTQCLCNDPWIGIACDTLPCTGINCLNGGSCKNATCYCKPPFYGPRCESTTCPNNCNPPNGICFNNKCQCAQGWTGPACDIPMCPNNCNNHGKCVNNTCQCDDGWTGVDCSQQEIICCQYCGVRTGAWWAECDKGKCRGFPDRRLVKSWDVPSAHTLEDCILRSDCIRNYGYCNTPN